MTDSMIALISLVFLSTFAISFYFLFRFLQRTGRSSAHRQNELLEEKGFIPSDDLIDQYLDNIDSKDDINVRADRKKVLIADMRLNQKLRRECGILKDKVSVNHAG